MRLVLVHRMVLRKMSMAASLLTISISWRIVKWMPMDGSVLLWSRGFKLMTWSLKMLSTKFCVNFLMVILAKDSVESSSVYGKLKNDLIS